MIYELGTRSLLFKYLSLHLKNNYMSDILVSDEYSLDLAKIIYKYLLEYYPIQSFKDSDDNLKYTDSVADYYFYGTKDNDLDHGVKIYKPIETADANQSNIITYNRDVQITPDSLADINKYNIASWPLKDSVLQYVYNGIVVSNLSQIDEIAQAQDLMYIYGYKEEILGEIDNDFILLCYKIQELEKEKDITIVKSGYFDKTVEFYLRGLLEVIN